MKLYNSLGTLFVDYRKFYNLSQTDFADSLNVDLRTIQRWEKDLTLVKSEKEEDLVLATLIPYQLIHNLNGAVPIPTYYDLNTRKYSLTEQSNELPKLSWFLDQIDLVSENVRTIDFDYDIKYLEQFIDTQKKDSSYLNVILIKKAVELLPELNFISVGKSGYYSGHCVVLPIKKSIYKKLKNREISNKDLRAEDLTNSTSLEVPIFYRYDITGDSNETIFYLMSKFFRFFKELKRNYLMCGYTERDDNYELNKQIGLKIIWEDVQLQKELKLKYPPRFFEGDFKEFLSN